MRVEAPPHGAPRQVSGVLLDEATIARRVAELGVAISSDYAGREVVLVTLLRGGLYFLADLCRAIDGERSWAWPSRPTMQAARSSS